MPNFGHLQSLTLSVTNLKLDTMGDVGGMNTHAKKCKNQPLHS